MFNRAQKSGSHSRQILALVFTLVKKINYFCHFSGFELQLIQVGSLSIGVELISFVAFCQSVISFSGPWNERVIWSTWTMRLQRLKNNFKREGFAHLLFGNRPFSMKNAILRPIYWLKIHDFRWKYAIVRPIYYLEINHFRGKHVILRPIYYLEIDHFWADSKNSLYSL